jgi:CheY-like chemotaxis protein
LRPKIPAKPIRRLSKGGQLRPRILIYDDNEILLSTLKFVFSERGYEVFAFSEPKMCQAFDSVDLTCPADLACEDVIISDVNMPTKNGIDLIKERQQRGCKIKYRALMSADWTDSDLKSAHELDCYIFHKPFDLAEMLEWLDDCRDELNREGISATTGSAGDMEKTPQRNQRRALQRAADL